MILISGSCMVNSKCHRDLSSYMKKVHSFPKPFAICRVSVPVPVSRTISWETPTEGQSNQTHSHIHGQMIVSNLPVLNVLRLWGKPEQPEESPANMGRTCKLHSERPFSGMSSSRKPIQQISILENGWMGG